MKHPVGQTRNGSPVYVNLIGTQAATHIMSHPHLLDLAQEALGKIIAKGPEVNVEYDMGRAIGYSFVVTTTDKDTIFYARLVKEETYTRFVKNGKPNPTQYLTVTLRQDDDKSYELTDLWIGRLNPPRPGSANETAESRPYWENHAFIVESRYLQLQTVTKVCPY